MSMLYQCSTRAVGVALAAALTMAVGSIATAAAADAKYPNWKGQWIPVNGQPIGGQRDNFDPTKPAGPGQQAPLTPAYQKVLESSMADQPSGACGNDPPAH